MLTVAILSRTGVDMMNRNAVQKIRESYEEDLQVHDFDAIVILSLI